MCCNDRTKVSVHFSSGVLKADRSFRSFDERMLGTPTQAWYILRWLDNLPDEDLNKLFDKITKVKTLRGHNGTKSRPESSLGPVDDIWSNQVDHFPAMLPMI